MIDLSIISIVSLVGFLILMIGAFASYRLSWGKTFQLVFVWLGIFAGGFLLAQLAGASF